MESQENNPKTVEAKTRMKMIMMMMMTKITMMMTTKMTMPMTMRTPLVTNSLSHDVIEHHKENYKNQHGRMARGDHGLLKFSPKPTVPYPSTPYG
jgi:hypothetical protein